LNISAFRECAQINKFISTLPCFFPSTFTIATIGKKKEDRAETSKWASSIGTTVPLCSQPEPHLVATSHLALTRSTAHDQTRASAAAASQSPSLVVATAMASTMPHALPSLDLEAATAAAPASLETVRSSVVSNSGERAGTNQLGY
jgi:hypothetical protein